MKRIICMKKVLLFLGGLIFVFGLSGCSTSMESVMDGADSVLNGLAHGANRVMEGFVEGANQTLDSLSEADESKLKDNVLETYGAFVDEIGAAALTPEGKLKGTLSKGPDNYTSSYEAIYSDFTGTELVFGGTTLRREEGNTLKIECSLSLENGDAVIFLLSGSDDPVTLLPATGKYTGTVKVDGESTYIGVRGRNAIRYKKFRKNKRHGLQISGRMKLRNAIRKETTNHVQENCTTKRGRNQERTQGTCARQRRGNPQRIVGR